MLLCLLLLSLGLIMTAPLPPPPTPTAPSPEAAPLPDDFFVELALRLPYNRDLLHLSQASRRLYERLAEVRGRRLRARQQFQRLVGCLSASGRDDPAWLAHFDLDLSQLTFPALPSDFPPDLLDLIRRQTTTTTASSSGGAIVEGVRRAYPDALRTVFPFNHRLAKAIVVQYPDRTRLRDVRLLRLLSLYGIRFAAADYHYVVRPFGCRWRLVGGAAADGQYAPYLIGPEQASAGPLNVLAEFLEQGRERALFALLGDGAFQAFLRRQPSLLFQGLNRILDGIGADLLRQLLRAPIVHDLLLRASPLSQVLFCNCVGRGRLDLGEIVVAEARLVLSPATIAMALEMLPIKAPAMAAFAALCQRHGLSAGLEAQLPVLRDRLRLRIADLGSSLVADLRRDPFVAALLGSD